MTRVLITGISGVGKSTVAAELAARGHHAVDVDTDEWSQWVDVADDDGVYPRRDWVWREERIRDLLAADDAGALFVSGCATNQVMFHDRFDHIVLLSAPADLIATRLTTRTTDAYGSTPDELARALSLKDTVEPLLRRVADVEVDTSAPLTDVVDAVLRRAEPPRDQKR